MASEAMKNAFAMIEANAQRRPSVAEFEMAYQVRVAMDRIRFAIRITEMSNQRSAEKAETLTQLADALDRLDSAERRFQDRWRKPLPPVLSPTDQITERNGANEHVS
jgi:hypothetical protein